MFRFLRSLVSRYYLQRVLLVTGIVLLMTWLFFFDSHNIAKRIGWHHELAQLKAQNENLQLEINMLEQKLEEADSQEVVEQIAREQYGMRRKGERIYRVEHQD